MSFAGLENLKPMSMTLWPGREQLRRESVLKEAELIFSERLWLPIYEEGGMDALMNAGEIPRTVPARSDLPNPGSGVK